MTYSEAIIKRLTELCEERQDKESKTENAAQTCDRIRYDCF